MCLLWVRCKGQAGLGFWWRAQFFSSPSLAFPHAGRSYEKPLFVFSSRKTNLDTLCWPPVVISLFFPGILTLSNKGSISFLLVSLPSRRYETHIKPCLCNRLHDQSMPTTYPCKFKRKMYQTQNNIEILNFSCFWFFSHWWIIIYVGSHTQTISLSVQNYHMCNIKTLTKIQFKFHFII